MWEMELPSKATTVMWMDEEYGKHLFKDDLADDIWEKVCLARRECNADQFVLVAVAMFKNRESGKYEGTFMASLLKKAKPSNITERQIEKRLRRMVQNRIPLLNLDTSNPDCMGKNLEKWLKVIKRFENEGTPINVMINSSPEFPAQLSPSLESSVVKVSF
ncbi:hypothetical protein NIES2111_66920 (plasmid) [Nostoc sp. NIES-2111]|nr:hypothetical protein NIES2111_66920 [Nostoc sp. NIES-2111]